MLTLPVTPIYHPYLNTNQTSLPQHQSNIPIHPPLLFYIYLPYLHLAFLSTSQQSIIQNTSSFLTNNFNLPSLLTSAIPTCIYLLYLNINLTSLIASIMPTHYTKPLQPAITPIVITPIHPYDNMLRVLYRNWLNNDLTLGDSLI